MRSAALIVGSTLILMACPGGYEGRGVLVGGTPVVGGKLSAFEISYPDDEPIGSATTDAIGRYRAEVHGAVGDLLVCVVGGRYRDLATSIDVDMGSEQLCAMALDVRAEAEEMVLNITPATHLAYSKAKYLSRALGVGLGEAYRIAIGDINGWLGCAGGGDVVQATPIDLTQPQQTADPASIHAGVIEGALSYQAKLISEARGITPGRQVNGKSLLIAYADDLAADGQLNGRGDQGDIYQFDYRLSAGSARGDVNGFAHGLSAFLHSSANKSGLTFADFRDFLACLSTAKGSLFAQAPPSLNAFDTGPEITVTAWDGNTGDELLEGQVLHSVVNFDVGATHDHGVESVTAWLDGSQTLRETGHSSMGWTFLLDTRSLRDGEHWLDLVATSAVVKAGSHRHEFVVDNSRPVITVREGDGWAKNGNDIRVAGSVNKDVESISVNFGGDTTTHPVRDGSFDFTLSVPCNAKSNVSLSVTDAAGNLGENQFTIRCDDTAPTIEWLKSDYSPERSRGMLDVDGERILDERVGVNEVIDPNAVTTYTFSKYTNRLDYLPEQGLDKRANNLPTIRLYTDDESSIGDGVSATVRVEYRYLVDGIEKRSWTPYPLHENVYDLPISYQTLHPDIWRSDCVHKIEARAFDAAGNESETLRFSFNMHTFFPPVTISGCTSDTVMAGRSYEHMLGIFNQPQVVDAYSGVVSWNFFIPVGSLMPRDPLNITLSSTKAHSHVSKISGRITPSHRDHFKFDRKENVCGMQAGRPPGSGNFENFVTQGGTLTCSPHGLKEVERVCDTLGLAPIASQTDIIPRPIHCASLRNSTEHNVSYRVQEMDGGPSSEGAIFKLEPNVSKKIVVALTGPTFRSGGANLHHLRAEGKPLVAYQMQRESWPPLQFTYWQYGLYAEAMTMRFDPLSAAGEYSDGSGLIPIRANDSCLRGLTFKFN